MSFDVTSPTSPTFPTSPTCPSNPLRCSQRFLQHLLSVSKLVCQIHLDYRPGLGTLNLVVRPSALSEYFWPLVDGQLLVLRLRQLNFSDGQHVRRHLLTRCLYQTVCNIVLRTDFSQPYFLVSDSILWVSLLHADVFHPSTSRTRCVCFGC